MAHPILRFAHVSNVRLDEPLRGVGRLPDAERRIAEDAPAVAWERVVEACVDRDVEFLLLTPQTSTGPWSEVDRRHLLEGFRQLEEFGIRVYWAVSADDAPVDEPQFGLPDNVTPLIRSGQTATVIREGRAVASLSLGRAKPTEIAAHETASAVTAGPRSLRIVIPTEPGVVDQITARACGVPRASVGSTGNEWDCDYVAGWGSSRTHSKTTGSTVWGDPGSPQGRSVEENGGGGVNIVEWDGARISDLQRAPTSPVRWERCVLGVAPETTHEEFAERMQLALLEREPAVGERVWLVDWHIVGSGPLFASLQSEAALPDLEQAANAAADGHNRLERVHRWHLRAREAGASDGLRLQLQEWLDQDGESYWSIVSRELESELRQGDQSAAADCLSLLSPAAIREAAERRLGTWLMHAAREAE